MTTGLSELPDFLRLSYFHGQMLAASDFQREQAYFVEKLQVAQPLPARIRGGVRPAGQPGPVR